MASDYDFVSMITVDGRLREEAAEARLMASMMNALGEKLSASKPCAAPTTLRCDFPCAQRCWARTDGTLSLFPSVELGCGWLMGASNLGEKDGILRFDTEDGEASLTVHGHKTVILPWKLDTVRLWLQGRFHPVGGSGNSVLPANGKRAGSQLCR